MGYTHYWTIKEDIKPTEWHMIMLGTSGIVNHCKRKGIILRSEYDENTFPEITKECIRFNGKGEEGHETFFVTPSRIDFEFTKTARKPYDLAVTMTLILMKQVLGDRISISSDGRWNTESEWMPARREYNEVFGEVPENILSK